MLFILTGDIQIGKTRWIERLVRDLGDRGVPAYGVVAPGVWKHANGKPSGTCASLRDPAERRSIGSSAFEKIGIDNVLLPEGRRIPFAVRRDVAQLDGSFDSDSQAARADLTWAIRDEAIETVNVHMGRLRRRPPGVPGLLVVDELGRLELVRAQGLTEALSLLEGGATVSFPHALAVVRESLLETALSRIDGDRWGGVEVFGPACDHRIRAVLDAFICSRK